MTKLRRADELVLSYKKWEVRKARDSKYMVRDTISRAYYPTNDSQEKIKATIDDILKHAKDARAR